MKCRVASCTASRRPWLNRLRTRVKRATFKADMRDKAFVAIYQDVLAKMLTADNPEPVKIRLLDELNRVGGRRKRK